MKTNTQSLETKIEQLKATGSPALIREAQRLEQACKNPQSSYLVFGDKAPSPYSVYLNQNAPRKPKYKEQPNTT